MNRSARINGNYSWLFHLGNFSVEYTDHIFIMQECKVLWCLCNCQEHYPIYMVFFVFPLFSCSKPHSFIMTSYNPIYSYFPSLTVCLHVQYSAPRWVSSFSFIPCHVIDHLAAMCQPHGFIVTDHDCSQPITSFVGFHVCLLLETKHGLCTGHFLYILCPFPEEFPKPRVSEFSSAVL